MRVLTRCLSFLLVHSAIAFIMPVAGRYPEMNHRGLGDTIQGLTKKTGAVFKKTFWSETPEQPVHYGDYKDYGSVSVLPFITIQQQYISWEKPT